MYYNLFISSIPFTRLISFKEFKRHQSGKGKAYILALLESFPNGLTCREISQISGIEISSLTYPLKELQDSGCIEVKSFRKNIVSNRLVQVYTLTSKPE